MDAARGRLIVFEGAEGVGKTTQVARLVARLGDAGTVVEAWREPGGTPLGERVRALVLETAVDVAPGAEALLFMAARAQLVAAIRPRLAAGTTIVLDRFFLSTYAYQVAGRGLAEGEVRAANTLAVDGLVPDLTLLLSCDADVAATRAAARGAPDRMERAGVDFHARVAAAFAEAVDPAWQAAHPETGPIALVDAAGKPEVVADRIAEALAARWPETFASFV